MSSIKLKITRHVKEKNTIHNEKQINRKQLEMTQMIELTDKNKRVIIMFHLFKKIK